MSYARSLSRRFANAFETAPRLWRAPGRINLIGEHVDYCGGPVLPGAIDLAVTVACAPNTCGLLRVRTPFGQAQLRLDRFVRCGDWRDYVGGMAFALAEAGHHGALAGHDLIIESAVPTGIGISSSAAVEVAVGLALSVGEMTGARLAKIAQRAENHYVGMPCGIMDQFASACGRADHLMLLDCATLEVAHVPFPANAALVLIDSAVHHTLATSAYGDRRADCEAAAATLGVSQLAEIDDLAALTLLRGNRALRARHVISEMARTRSAVAALAAGNLAEVGDLMNQSHASLSQDMQVSTHQVDRLALCAQSTPGVHGARMMGGGFGGSVIALVDADRADEACARLTKDWGAQIRAPAKAFVTRIGDGAHELTL
jgi:galactokinase